MPCKSLYRMALALAALAAGAAACGQQDSYDSATAVVLRQAELDQAGGSAFVSVTCQGDWTLSAQCSDAGTWATVSPASGSGNKGDIQLSYQANPGEHSRSVTLTLKPANGATATVTAYQAGVQPEPETPAYGYDVAPMGWLELPATQAGDGRELLAHGGDGGLYRSGVRNWSCYWDYDDRVSVWVAYPLNNNLKGSGERTNAWGYDPLLPQDLQQSITLRFSSTNRYYSDPLYDRGHQIPSADRLVYSANVSTFYATNMTPQSNAFNSGIWANLEGAVRGYAGKADTLYVVSGCIVDNTQTFVRDVAGHQIAVPTAYFKALLFKGTSTYATNGYMAAGFLLPHDDAISGKDYRDYICSIDQLEKETGWDFFPRLQQVLGKEKADQIEAQEPSKWWK